MANTTNKTIVTLSEKLANFMPTLNRVFYAGDGSSAIEIAIKISLHTRKIRDEPEKTNFIALRNGYHGETIGALSVSDVGIYKDPYQKILFNTHFISNIPYVLNSSDKLWSDCSSLWEKVENSLEKYAKNTTALIVEPIVQGAGGMKIYSQNFLQRLRKWAKKYGIHLIADEIMTGIGRTGKMFACEYADVIPDFLCLSKGLTSGWMPFSAVITNNDIYNTFYDDYENNTAFLHSHTYSGNALAASIALETLNIVKEEKLCERANYIGKFMVEQMKEISDLTGVLANIRNIGAIVAADLVHGSLANCNRIGYRVYLEAVKLGALLRPIGNTIYWLPPLNVELEVIEDLKIITLQAIKRVYSYTNHT